MDVMQFLQSKKTGFVSDIRQKQKDLEYDEAMSEMQRKEDILKEIRELKKTKDEYIRLKNKGKIDISNDSKEDQGFEKALMSMDIDSFEKELNQKYDTEEKEPMDQEESDKNSGSSRNFEIPEYLKIKPLESDDQNSRIDDPSEFAELLSPEDVEPSQDPQN